MTYRSSIRAMLLIILHLIPDADAPYDIVAELMGALPSGSYLVLAHPASDIRAAQMAEMTRRVNARMSGPAATMRDRAAITRFFDGLDLVEPGVVQPQQWRRPVPGMLSPPPGHGVVRSGQETIALIRGSQPGVAARAGLWSAVGWGQPRSRRADR